MLILLSLSPPCLHSRRPHTTTLASSKDMEDFGFLLDKMEEGVELEENPQLLLSTKLPDYPRHSGHGHYYHVAQVSVARIISDSPSSQIFFSQFRVEIYSYKNSGFGSVAREYGGDSGGLWREPFGPLERAVEESRSPVSKGKGD